MRLPTILTRTRSEAVDGQPRRAEIPTATITPSSPVASLSDQHEHPPTTRPLAFEPDAAADEEKRSHTAQHGLRDTGLSPRSLGVVGSASTPDLRNAHHPLEGAGNRGDVSPADSDGVLFEKQPRHSSSTFRHDAPQQHGILRHAHFDQAQQAGADGLDHHLLSPDYARHAGHRPDHLAIDMNGSEPAGLLERAKSPTPSSHAPPQSFQDLTVLYNVVAERRNAFDALLWQVPATSLTGHAFLFSIALAPDTSKFARVASMGLCILITGLTLHLFTRQLQAEDADNKWLADFEERHSIDFADRAHGDRWKFYRNRKPPGAGWLGWLALHRSYPLWSRGLLSIGALALAIILITIFAEDVMLGYNCQPFADGRG